MPLRSHEINKNPKNPVQTNKTQLIATGSTCGAEGRTWHLNPVIAMQTRISGIYKSV
jgi:hypothetical protein